ncbi:MAG TPA: PAS domain-containing protein [Polyangia bacterium]|nr:PAS domain-containing protein [Polyangia bacterium]
MVWLAVLVGLLGVWVIALRRQLGDLHHAVRHQQERQVALDERYADLTGNVTDAVFAIDLEGRFTAVNPAGADITGRPRAEILRGSIFDLIVPEARDDARAHLARAIAAGGRGDLRFEITIAAADARPVRLVGQLRLLTQQGFPVGFEGVAHELGARSTAAGTRGGDPAEPERQLVA